MTLELPAHPQLILRTAVVPADGILEGPRELRRLPEGAHEIPYELFGLRDADSSKDDLFHQFGILRDDYTSKPAFTVYKDLIRQLSS